MRVLQRCAGRMDEIENVKVKVKVMVTVLL